jgi:endonuclease YncB( thermonuclease family)
VIKDGDSFVFGGQDIRLWGIDAPEYDQICQRSGRDYDCGRAARDYLAALADPLGVICRRGRNTTLSENANGHRRLVPNFRKRLTNLMSFAIGF